jgi:hypothetical protein
VNNLNTGGSQGFGLVDSHGTPLDNAIAAKEGAIANLRTGGISTNTLVASGTATLEDVVAKNLTVDLSVSNGRLVVKGANSEDVFSVDSAGNAYLKGVLTADKIRANQIEGLEVLTNHLAALDTSVASISGFTNGAPVSSSEAAVLSDTIQNGLNGVNGRIDTIDQRVSSVESLAQTTASAAALLSDLMNTELSSGSSSASFGGMLENLDVAGDATIAGQLNILGRTVANDLSVTGTLSNGILSFDGANGALGTLVGPLKIQPLGLGGVDILAGKVVIDTNGNITTSGAINAAEVNTADIYTDKISVTAEAAGATTSAVLSASAGTIIIPAGETSVVVTTSKLTNGSLIFTTPDTPVTLGTKKTGANSFTISLQSAQGVPVKVNWWIVN